MLTHDILKYLLMTYLLMIYLLKIYLLMIYLLMIYLLMIHLFIIYLLMINLLMKTYLYVNTSLGTRRCTVGHSLEHFRGPPKYPNQILGKSVQGFLSYDRKNNFLMIYLLMKQKIKKPL